jgi:hypothetical protein
MSDQTSRFKLPLLVPGQAQKELFHNEALTRVDIALHASVRGSAAVPPAAPVEGESWVVGEAAGGAWAGKHGSLASWTSGGWRYVAPEVGMRVWDSSAGYWSYWSGSAWLAGEVPASRIVVGGHQVVGSRQPHVPNPSGGTIIDAEARAAVSAVIAALMQHGLIE